jgi:hypothetical protein
MTKIKSVICRSLSVRPRLAPLLLLALGAFALGAKCIDRTSTYVDADGYTHITGEMVNDSNIQGTNIVLRGTLMDDAGNIVATKDAPTCPPDTQPHQQTIFDIRFDNPNVPPWTKFEVRPISGKALDAPLPDPKVVLSFPDAIRFTADPKIPGVDVTEKDVLFAFQLRNQTNNSYDGVQGCAAVFDHAGNVIWADSAEVIHQNDDGSIEPAVVGPQELTSIFWVGKNVPTGPVQVRAWLWFGQKGDPTSQYQFVTTGLITIRPVTP